MTPATVAPEGHTNMTVHETEQWIRALGNDQCSRCNGLMIAEWSDDLSDYIGRRCVLCGDLIDPVVLCNRRRQQTGTLGAGKT